MTTKYPILKQELIIKDTGHSDKGRQLYELTKSLTFEYKVNGGGLKITVPKSFVTDFASIPRIFWIIFPPFGMYSKAAVIHDYLYRLKDCSRFLADSMFREAMYQLGVPTWKRLIMYYAVRICGGVARRIAKNDKEIIDQFHLEDKT